MDTKHHEALRLAHIFEHPLPPEWSDMVAATKELRRLHAENEAMRTGCDAARLEIESLQARIQELGQQARECSDRKVVQLESALAMHVRSGKDWAMRVEALERTITTLRAHIASSNAQAAAAKKAMRELEAQVAAVGAGGVEPLRKSNSVEFDGIKSPSSVAPIIQLAAPVRWPKNAAEVREFFRSDFIQAEFAAENHNPCDEDRYYISAHDFLSAINWWADFPNDDPSDECLHQIAEPDHFRGATKMVQASEPVVLPEPVAAQSRFADTPSDTWESCSVEHARSFGGVGYEVRYLYTEQQVRAAIAAAKGE